jgi:hypothetical protein
MHPALSAALATAHIEDLHRAATRSHTVRPARHGTRMHPRTAVHRTAILRPPWRRTRGRRTTRTGAAG